MDAIVANAQPVSASGVMALTREELLRIAVARGCQHYAPLLPPGAVPADVPDLPHEALGTLLLRGAPDAATFQAIRVGAMVLSDLANDPQRLREAAARLGVTARVAHLAQLGLAADHHPEFWTAIAQGLLPNSAEASFFPGISRLTSETRMAGPGRRPSRVWLRTRYAR